MDNGQMPPVQKTIPVRPAGNGMPMVQQVQLMPEKKKDISGLVKTIVIIIVSLIAVTFIGLFIWIKEGLTKETVMNGLMGVGAIVGLLVAIVSIRIFY